jgi:hypothetical protein
MGPGLTWPRLHKTTYAPMIYMSLCVWLLMWADRLRGEVGGGGVGAGNREFCGPCEISASAIWGPQNSKTQKPYARGRITHWCIPVYS